MSYSHIPAMPAEVIHYLHCQRGKTYVDCTLGGSGHAGAILERIVPDGLLIGIDQDRDAVVNAEEALSPYLSNVRLFTDNFSHLKEILSRLAIGGVDGILMDLGVSQHQIESGGRGFSFRKDEPLDMRMSTETVTTAAHMVNRLSERDLKRVFVEFGEERWAGRIARKIVEERKRGAIASSLGLADIVSRAVPGGNHAGRRIHPATRVFMALRIAVNQELENLTRFMGQVVDLLNPGGRLCVLSFHSLEDRIVKHRFREFEKGCTCPPDFPICVCGKQGVVRVLTKKVVRPTEEEIIRNPMARSTRLRALERLAVAS